MKTFLRPLLVVFVALTVLTGLAYPLVVTGAAQAIFPAQAHGSLVLRDGTPVGSILIGQNFSGPENFCQRLAVSETDRGQKITCC